MSWHVFITSEGKGYIVRKVVHKSVQDFIFMMAEQSGISREQATVTFNSIISYMKQHPKHSLQKAIAAIFGTGKTKDEDVMMN